VSGRDPFEQLARSHRRLEELLDALQTSGTDPDLLRDAAAFFARNVRRHEQDEELSLFPRLASIAELAPLLERLAREHREHERLHAELDAIVQELDRGAAPSGVRIDALVDALVGGYRDHLEVEERELFPAAQRVLGASDLAAMAAEMDARRGGGGGGGRRRSEPT
jgi:hemerythrin-like domain-containing protein